MSRVYNFSAGPAVLPEEVLQEAAAEMMDYKGSGMSVMEVVKRCNMMLQRYYFSLITAVCTVNLSFVIIFRSGSLVRCMSYIRRN